MRSRDAAQRTGRRICNLAARRIQATSWASRQIAGRIQLYVRLDRGHAVGITRCLLVLQCPNLNRAVILAKVIDAGVLL